MKRNGPALVDASPLPTGKGVVNQSAPRMYQIAARASINAEMSGYNVLVEAENLMVHCIP